MANITIRNIPEDIFSKIKKLSDIERRSINNQLLIIIEQGTAKMMELKKKEKKNISKSIQIDLWKKISGTWKDDRSTKEIINDIYENRTIGREIEL